MKVKLLDPRAKVPTVKHPHWDLGYDLYALEDTFIPSEIPTKVRTGIAIEFPTHWGGIIKDRSSVAAKGVTTSGGVIDSGYRGEIIVILNYHHPAFTEGFRQYEVVAGDKIAQLVLQKSLTYESIEISDELNETDRGEKGFGSSGR
jgi:dUTP pyrophosphatase